MAVWSEATAPSCYDHTFAAAFQPLYIYTYISLGDDPVPANFLGFRGLATLLPHFCQLSVPEVGVCGAYPESP